MNEDARAVRHTVHVYTGLYPRNSLQFHSTTAICACLSMTDAQETAHSLGTQERKTKRQKETHLRHGSNAGRPCALALLPPHRVCPTRQALPGMLLLQCPAQHVRCRGLGEEERRTKNSYPRAAPTLPPAKIFKTQQHALLRRVENVFSRSLFRVMRRSRIVGMIRRRDGRRGYRNEFHEDPVVLLCGRGFFCSFRRLRES